MSLLSTLSQPGVLSALPVGAAFGFCLEKSKVYLPYLIMEQMRFKRFTMLEIFLTATAVSTLGVLALDRLNVVKRQPRAPSALGFLFPSEYGANILGGLLIGAGMSLTGACPGTVFVQLASGMKTAMLVVAGAMTSAFSLGYLTNLITRWDAKFMAKGTTWTVPQLLRWSDEAVTILFASACLATTFVVDAYFPWQRSTSQVAAGVVASQAMIGFDPASPVWSPVSAGIGIGLTQMASLILTGIPLGASSSYCVLAAHVVKAADSNAEKKMPFYKSFLTPSAVGQGLLGLGMIAGGWLSLYLSGGRIYPFGVDKLALNSVSNVQAFFGGAILLLGSRVAGGCTSGHGISGMSMMGLSSFVTVAAMFAGGMATVAIRDYLFHF